MIALSSHCVSLLRHDLDHFTVKSHMTAKLSGLVFKYQFCYTMTIHTSIEKYFDDFGSLCIRLAIFDFFF